VPANGVEEHGYASQAGTGQLIPIDAYYRIAPLAAQLKASASEYVANMAESLVHYNNDMWAVTAGAENISNSSRPERGRKPGPTRLFRLELAV
jgi:hypothetical protein